MDPHAILSLTNYDLQKLSKLCNFRNCERLPSKQMVIQESDLRSSKELVSIYFCTEHYESNVEDIMSKLSGLRKEKKILEKRVFNIRYITC